MTAREQARETLAEALSHISGAFTRYSPDAVDDHNRWSWHGDGHPEFMRDDFRRQADELLAALGLRLEWRRELGSCCLNVGTPTCTCGPANATRYVTPWREVES